VKILLAMDTSSASQVALEEIAARPWPPDSSFEVLTVIEPSHLWTTSEVAQEAARWAQEVVQRAAGLLQSKGRKATGVALSGDPKTAILDRARSTGADFIIVGSHGVSALTRFFLGNVAAAVLRYAPCSVCVARARATSGGHGNMRVLLATDGSESSARAAQSIAERPWPAGAEVRILSVAEVIWPRTPPPLEPPFIDSGFTKSVRADAMKWAQDAIAHARQILSATSLNVSESIPVFADRPKLAILDEAARWDADLIVLGSHGHRGVDRFLLGSVSEAVAMHAGCSVEVIRTPRE